VVDLPLTPGLQDDLSVQIAMMVELLHARTPEHLSVIDRNSARDYRYRREGAETISTGSARSTPSSTAASTRARRA